MEVTLGMEFQTPDANFLLYRDYSNTAYYYSYAKIISLTGGGGEEGVV